LRWLYKLTQKMDINKLKNRFSAFVNNASTLLKDKNKTHQHLNDVIAKATANQHLLKDVWQKLQLLAHLAIDYTNGTYTKVSPKTVAIVIGGLLYFLSPIDLIPDFILGLGFMDDIFIIGYVYNKVAKELEKYQQWKDNQQVIIKI
jgi:uncharacterized membrane protein YkvA (DUF1232 family)